MPYTLSHVIAVVPFFKWVPQLPLSALAIGSMIPDLTLFFPVSNYHFAHSLLGIVLFCLPWGLLLYVFFEAIGKHFLIACLPLWAQYRLASYRRQPLCLRLRSWCWVSAALILGAFTHVLWDGFTHAAADTFVKDYIEPEGWLGSLYGLQRPLVYGDGVLPIYKYLQYISSVIGLMLVVLVGVMALRKRVAEVAVQPVALWLRWAVVALHVVTPFVVLVCYGLMGGAYSKVSGLVIDSMTVSLVFWLAASLIYWLKVHRPAS